MYEWRVIGYNEIIYGILHGNTMLIQSWVLKFYVFSYVWLFPFLIVIKCIFFCYVYMNISYLPLAGPWRVHHLPEELFL